MFDNLTQREVPTGSKILFISDVHVPIDNRPAVEVVINACEDIGVTHVVAAGDIFDLHCLSSHPKDVGRLLENGTVREEVARGEYLMRWFSTRPTKFIEGNHEARLHKLITDNPGLYGLKVPEVLGLPKDWVCLERGSVVQLGSLWMSHGDAEFKGSTGGKTPAQRLLEMAPDHSSMIGHLHRRAEAIRTSFDSEGIRRSRAAYLNPHLSIQEKHEDYVSRHTSWQLGATVVNVNWMDQKPRWDLTYLDVHHDSRNRPFILLGGKVYR